MTSYPITRKLHWHDFEQAMDMIISYIQTADIKIANIYGIPRGGLVMAVALSNRLGRPLISSRTRITPYTLIVDDMCDHGQSISHLLWNRKDRKEYKVVVWIMNADVIPDIIPTFWVEDKKNSDVIIFPWETSEQPTQLSKR